jgi:3-dehydroquinate synthase
MKDSIHPIYFDVANLADVLKRLAVHGKTYSSVFILADKGIPQHARRLFLGETDEKNILVLPGGEPVKTIQTVESIWQFLLDAKADRKALVVNLGGGAVCDAGGFAASTFKRGIDFVHVPSTLLSMVDASVGGKTGINMGGIKNTVGTFTMPTAVFIYPNLLDSLPPREMLSGYAEMIKHGLVANATHLESVLNDFSTTEIPSDTCIRDSIHIKSAIVGRDPLEEGERKLLNFGHTIGHGLESHLAETEGSEILHGEAVAAGILVEMYISSKLSGFSIPTVERFREKLVPLTQHVNISPDMIPAILEKISNDKKNEDQEIGITLLNEHGAGVWGKTVSKELIEEALLYFINR